MDQTTEHLGSTVKDSGLYPGGKGVILRVFEQWYRRIRSKVLESDSVAKKWTEEGGRENTQRESLDSPGKSR